MTDTELVVTNYKAAMSLDQAAERWNEFLAIVRSRLQEGVDFDPAIGTPGKPGYKLAVLKQPGAQKLASIYGLTPRYTINEKELDWTGAEHGGEPMCSYTITCEAYRGDIYMGSGIANCNSMESKYRYRWMGQDELPAGYDVSKCMRRTTMIEEYGFSIEKGETTGKYGKDPAYWQQFRDAIANKTAEAIEKKAQSGKTFLAYRIMGTQFRVPNPDIFDQFNTVLKMSQKRAFVSAVILVTNASVLFTMDVEEDEHGHSGVYPEYDEPPPHQRGPVPPIPTPQTTPKPATKPEPPSKPEPKPQPKRDEPEEMAKLRATMPGMTREQRLQVFAQYKRELIELLGDETGNKVYYGILIQRHKVDHSSQFGSLSKALACLVDLVDTAIQARGETVAEEQPNE